MKVEIYGTSRMQEGHKANEDAFIIGRSETAYAAVCDGAGNAEQSAKRVLQLFEKFVREARSDDLVLFPTWRKWVTLLDTSLLGGSESTFLAVAVLDGRFIGACAGDSRAYLRDNKGQLRIITEQASKRRLGSGQAEAFPIHQQASRGDLLLLMSDGAWTPLNKYRVQKILSAYTLKHLADLPGAILDEASRAGRADDMTVIAMKVLQG